MLFKYLMGGIKVIKSPSKKKHSGTYRPKKEERDSPKGKQRWVIGRKPSHKHTQEVLLSFDDEGIKEINISTGFHQDNEIIGEAQACFNGASTAVIDAVTVDSQPTDDKAQREQAVIKMQTAFRGYLARKALRALKSLVRLQALARGRFVRKQAGIKLQCMQALLRVESCIHTLQSRLYEEAQALQCQLHSRKFINGWDNSRSSLQELQDKAQTRQRAVIRRQRALAYAFSEQLRKSAVPNPSSMALGCESDQSHSGWSWLERWMAAKPWENSSPEGGLFSKLDVKQQQPSVLSRTKRLANPSAGEPLPRGASSKQISKAVFHSPSPCPNPSVSPQPTRLMAGELSQPTSSSDLHCMSTASVSPLSQLFSKMSCSTEEKSHRSPLSGESRSYESHSTRTGLASDGQEVKDDANSGPNDGIVELSLAAECSTREILRKLKLSMERRANMAALHKVDEVENAVSPIPSYMVMTRSSKAKAYHSHSNPIQKRQEGAASSPLKRRHSLSG